MAVSIEPATPFQRFAGALRYPTISNQENAAQDRSAFIDLHHYLEISFPQIHNLLQLEIVNELSLLFTWKGADESLKPALFAAHLDVVPIEPGTEENWSCPPFEGRIKDGYIWGRGTMDNKVAVMAILEAVENLLHEGFQPQRTIYLAFGHDEEIGGRHGALSIAQLLRNRGITLETALDEGLAVVEGLLPMIQRPVALVGIAEKGYLSLELSVNAQGGHSSIPPTDSAIGLLSKAIHRLESNPFPARLDGPISKMLAALSPSLPAALRLAVKNVWLSSRLLINRLSASPATNAIMRTTLAPTIFHAGIKENIIPSHAKAVINLRLLPGDTIENAVEFVRDVINDPRIKIQEIEGMKSQPSPVSSTDSASYELIKNAIEKSFHHVLVAPGLVLGGTDCRYYAPLTPNAYRFSPLWIKKGDLERVHGTNERISLENYQMAIQFYKTVIANFANYNTRNL